MIKTITIQNFEGTKIEISVGDHVQFKCDIEQTAEVVEIKSKGGRDYKLIVKAPLDGFSGNYIGRANFAEIDADQIW